MRVESYKDDSGKPRPFEKHDRLALEFNNGQRLVFNDTRKFGRVWLVERPGSGAGQVLAPNRWMILLTPDAFFEMLHTPQPPA